MSEFNPPRAPRPRRALRGTLRQSRGPSAPVIIGFAHVILGAIGVLNVLFSIVFHDFAAPVRVVVALLIGAVASGVVVVAGLWLAEGRRRGAVVACTMDAVRGASLLYVGALFTLDFACVLALGIAAVWVAPQLDLPAGARGD